MTRDAVIYVIQLAFALSVIFGDDAVAQNVGGREPPQAPTDYALVITGGELLRGAYADGHTLFITRTLGLLGCRCVGTLCVGDDENDLYDALAYAGSRASLVIVTGGLGPTDDDVTRKTLSKYTGIALEENSDAIAAMVRRFGVQNPDDLRENLRRQTLTPERGTYLPNPVGSAVGLVFEDEARVVVALPGPPRELQPMVKDSLVPYLADRYGIHANYVSLTLRFVGIGESQIDQVMHERMTLPEELRISSLFNLGRVDLTLSLPSHSQDDIGKLKSLEHELLSHIGEYMYSDEGQTLEERVIDLMSEKGASLVTVEMGSGGAIAASLNRGSAAASVYRGGYVANGDSEMAERLGLSITTPAGSRDGAVQAIAEQACKATGSQWGLVVSEVMKADEESPYVWVALGTSADGFHVTRVRLRGHGETGNARLVNRALDLLRRELKKM